ncbi:MAG TPA: hypothetical protein VGL00_09760 [Terracidiphilus sp.]|jgi:hypothetical protein
MPDSTPTHPPDEHSPEFAHALLFTGHMIDRADRTRVRFPAWAESRARNAIQTAIAEVDWTRPGATVGLAGGASGGDLLFHECCRDMGIATRLLLALPPHEFESTSVAPAGPEWVKRFHILLERTGNALHIMQQNDGKLEGASDNIWQRSNLWMIGEASRLAPERALLALWDGEAGDGPGGTGHFLEVARRFGIRILPPIDMQTVLAMKDESGSKSRS